MTEEQKITLTMSELEELCLDAVDEILDEMEQWVVRGCNRAHVQKAIREFLEDRKEGDT